MFRSSQLMDVASSLRRHFQAPKARRAAPTWNDRASTIGFCQTLLLNRRSGVVLLLLLLHHAVVIAQQISDNPSDASTSLTFTTNAGVSNALTAACATGSLNPASGDFSLALAPAAPATSTAATIAGPAPCGNFQDLPPSTPSAACDAWFRLDPPATAHRFRVTLLPGSASPMTNGAMAIYEAPSAAGPFRLLECATGGSSVTLSSNQPTLEATCLTAGYKLYVRVWDEQARSCSLTFKLCVQGQDVSTMASRGADEAPCTGPMLAASASTYTNVDYVFACNESPWLFADSSQYVGGDLWLRITVPASGIVGLYLARGTSNYVNNIGVTTYSASNCSAPTSYRQVGNFYAALPVAAPTTPNLTVSCLSPGSILYVRIHSFRQAQSATLRYGRLRIRWTAGPTGATPPANNLPCGAVPLSFNTSCPVSTGPGGNFDACNTPGIPRPACGGFDGNSRDVWYSFVAPSSGTVHVEASTVSSGFPADPAIALYTTGGSGCSGRFTLIECDEKQGLGNGAAIIRTGLVPGETYYVRAWAEGSGGQGTFSLCISEPVPPAGSCFYVVDLWAANPPISTTYQGVQYEIDGGSPITLQTTTGDEASQLFLIPVTAGSQLQIQYFNQDVGEYKRLFYQLGDTTMQWRYHGGIAVTGPQPTPIIVYTIASACNVLPAYLSDCLGAETVCTPNTEFGNLYGMLLPGNTYDLTAANMGCLSNENGGIAWMIFRPVQSGTVAFWFDGTTNAPTTDLDFAVWDAGPVTYTPVLPYISPDICAPNSPPVRCSSARRNYSTGLQPGLEGVYEEGTGGWGWLSPLPVVANHVYLIALVRGVGSATAQYQMRWTMYNDATGTQSNTMLNCTPLILPVELLFLEAEPIEKTVVLRWATASESDSEKFLVERSSNGSVFHPIGEVAAAGHSTRRLDYTFLDEAPLNGQNYYRLRQLDQSGGSALSNTVTAFFGRERGTPVAYPNPTGDRLYLTLPSNSEGPLTLRIVDAMGRVVWNRTIASATTGSPEAIGVSQLAPGPYALHITEHSGDTIGTVRFVKE